MKLKNIIASVLLTLGVGAGLATGLATVTRENKLNDFVEVEAAATQEWIFTTQKANSKTPYCYIWQDGTSYNNGWPGKKMKEFTYDGTTYYGISTDGVTNANRCIFTDGSSWQTGDLVLSVDGNVATSYSKGSANVTWKSVFSSDYYFKNDELAKSEETMRIFINNDHEKLGDWKSSDAIFAIRFWGGKNNKIYNTFSLVKSNGSTAKILTIERSGIIQAKWFGDNNGTNKWYGYFDIPKDISGFQIVRLNKEGNQIWNHGKTDITSFKDGAIAKVFYLYVADGKNTYEEVELSTGFDLSAQDYKVGSELMSKVLEAYYSCSSDPINGKPAAQSIQKNFYNNLKKEEFKNTTITGENGSSYTISHKMNELLSISSASLSGNFLHLSKENNVIPGLVIVFLTIGTLMFTFIFAFKKYQKR